MVTGIHQQRRDLHALGQLENRAEVRIVQAKASTSRNAKYQVTVAIAKQVWLASSWSVGHIEPIQLNSI